jgi:sugar lactone lactonase YvrE
VAGITADNTGNIYVIDVKNYVIRKITTSGVVTTLAGTQGISGNTDGNGINASFFFTNFSSIAADSSNNLYVSDSNNDTIRKITPAGDVTTLAGLAQTPGTTDQTGAAARFNWPTGIATDSTGNVYVADSNNHTVRKITPGGVVSTLAGQAGISGNLDGAGTTARFNTPEGLATDNSGNVYVSDTSNHTIRKIDSTGQVSTLAGQAGISGSLNATGTAASFNFPIGITLDNSTGNLYVADQSNHIIRKINLATKAVTTAVGVAGQLGFTPGFLQGTTQGTLTSPRGVVIFGTSLYISTGNMVAVATGY